MIDSGLGAVLEKARAAVLAAAVARMSGDSEMTRVAAQRELSQADLSEQILGFWLQAVNTDLTLGSTAAMKQNLDWLLRFRTGHALPFSDSAVRRCFVYLSDEIEARLQDEGQLATYAAYRREVERLMDERLSLPEAF